MRKSLLLLVALLSIFSISAKQVSETEAALIATNFFKTNTSGITTKSVPTVSLAHEFKSDDATLMYAFNNGANGYVLVSGDDSIVPVLGYSDNGQFDYNNLPDNARTWFEMYGQMIKSVKEGKAKPFKTYASDSSVEPLVVAQWNQGYPYWNLTPQINGNQCYTGCPATAMAQIAYYHKWPVKSTGSIDYVTDSKNIHITAELNTTFDWANMTPTYDKNSSEESCTAVAELMRDAGYAMDMDYTDEGSGSTQNLIARAIVDNLGYDKGLRIQYATTYDPEDWVELLKEELDAARPILYCGYTKMQEGHAFVCDGYNEEGLFHINWGWGGVSNGYFVITALDPESQGMGGANSGAGFNQGQLAIVNIQKPVDDSVAIPYTLLYSENEMEVTETTLELTLNNFVNGGYRPFNGDLMCGVIAADRSVVLQFRLASDFDCQVFEEKNYTFSISKDAFIDNLEDGDYLLYFYTVDENGTEVEVDFSCDLLKFHKEDDEISFETESEPELVGFNAICTSSSDEYSEYLFSFKFKNESSEVFSAALKVGYSGVADDSGLASVSSITGKTELVSFSINPGETKDINVPSGQLHNHMDYTLKILGENDEEVNDSKFEFNSGRYHPIEFRDAKVQKIDDDYVLNAKIVNISAKGEVYENKISCLVYTELSLTKVSETELSIKVSPNEEVEVTIPLDTDELDFGEYRAILCYVYNGKSVAMQPGELNAIPFAIKNLPNLSASNFSLECARTSETISNYTITYDITNESNFYYDGELQVKFVGEDSEDVTPIVNVVLAPGETVSVTHEPQYVELKNEQNYQFEIIEAGSAPIKNNTFEFEVPEEHGLEHRDGHVYVEDNELNISVNIVNIYDSNNEEEEMVYSGIIELDIYTINDELVKAFTTKSVTIGCGQTVVIRTSIPVENLPAGSYYLQLACDDETIIYPSKAPELHFEIIDDPASIGDINVDDSNRIVNVVSVDGRIIKQNVNASDAHQGLAPGIYFIGNKKVFIK